jgi:hypothetical protein
MLVPMPASGAGRIAGCDSFVLSRQHYVTVVLDGNRPRISIFDPAGPVTRESLQLVFAMLLLMGMRFRRRAHIGKRIVGLGRSAFHDADGTTWDALRRTAAGIVSDYAPITAFNALSPFPDSRVDLTEHLQVPVPKTPQQLSAPLALLEEERVDYVPVVVSRELLYPHAAMWFAMFHVNAYGYSDTPDDFVSSLQAKPLLSVGSSTSHYVAENVAAFLLRLGEACFRPPLDYTPRTRPKRGEERRDDPAQETNPAQFW